MLYARQAASAAHDPGGLTGDEAAALALDGGDRRERKTVGVDLSVGVVDASDGVLGQQRLDRTALGDVEPAHVDQLAGLLARHEVLEDLRFLLDDGEADARQLVIHGVDSAVLDDPLAQVAVHPGGGDSELEVRPWPEVLADQRDDPVAVAGGAAANRLLFQDHDFQAGRCQLVGGRRANDPGTDHHDLGGLLADAHLVGLMYRFGVGIRAVRLRMSPGIRFSISCRNEPTACVSIQADGTFSIWTPWPVRFWTASSAHGVTTPTAAYLPAARQRETISATTSSTFSGAGDPMLIWRSSVPTWKPSMPSTARISSSSSSSSMCSIIAITSISSSACRIHSGSSMPTPYCAARVCV